MKTDSLSTDSVPARLRRLRVQAGLTQEQLAVALGVGRTTYIAHEEGRRNVIPDVLEKAAEYFNIPLIELIFGVHIDDQVLLAQADFTAWKQTVVGGYEDRLAESWQEIKQLKEELAKKENSLKSLEETNHFLLTQLRKGE